MDIERTKLIVIKTLEKAKDKWFSFNVIMLRCKWKGITPKTLAKTLQDLQQENLLEWFTKKKGKKLVYFYRIKSEEHNGRD